jgi:hypothetical protein
MALYTEGYNAFVQQDNIQLYRVLENWRTLAMRMVWQEELKSSARLILKNMVTNMSYRDHGNLIHQSGVDVQHGT